MVSGRPLIVLAYYFPPLVGVASERWSALTLELAKLGWAPVVVAPSAGFYHRDQEARDGVGAVIRTRSLELSRGLRRAVAVARGDDSASAAGDEIRPLTTGRAAELARRLVRDFVYVPDAQIGWLPFAVAGVRSACRRFDQKPVLVSTSVPYTAHLAAMRVAGRDAIPWVAEFRDPWSTGTFPDRSRFAARRSLDHKLERRIVDRADHVVVTSGSTREELLAAHPSLTPERISVVRNGFVPIPDRPPPPSSEPMTILYAGTVNRGENLQPVLEALDDLHTSYPGAFRLRVLGPPEKWRQARGPAGRDWLELAGIVTPREARVAMYESSALLLLQSHPAYRSILPGKAFEYIGARRPILGIVLPGQELAELLDDHADARLVPPDDPGQLRSALESLLQEHRAGQLQAPRVSLETIMPLQRAEQAKRLGGILDRVAERIAG